MDTQMFYMFPVSSIIKKDLMFTEELTSDNRATLKTNETLQFTNNT